MPFSSLSEPIDRAPAHAVPDAVWTGTGATRGWAA